MLPDDQYRAIHAAAQITPEAQPWSALAEPKNRAVPEAPQAHQPYPDRSFPSDLFPRSWSDQAPDLRAWSLAQEEH